METDLKRIWNYGLERWGVEAADRYHAAFFRHFEQLAAQPLLYPAVDDIRDGYGRSMCGRDSVYYRVKANTIEIMAIIGRQDLEKWL